MGMQSRAKVRVRPFPLSAPKQPEPFKAARALVFGAKNDPEPTAGPVASHIEIFLE